ncbi:hypothetical protein SAMD00019534_066990 [Acytostelium subglobosum LB1]|uniref:hypothetical protein n=1 Tax=Acytostelium subglobosum LB1 TaxID=1410327 RepID=UPI000644906F|nr:hypothetical protein SAMD00019534_066990 [Acytostelium subglobosum LB1]GAM23524.1 hypothetical protein SAMD00019534_066990 [Acytostelium subglobosum LB1]|eukprot:XP_012753265.1 hypothetical protein SAMD00019534_066990 [Acytostelium subglobosum LB1]
MDITQCNDTFNSTEFDTDVKARAKALQYLEQHNEIKTLRVLWVDVSNIIRCKAVRTTWLLQHKSSFNYVCVTNACMSLRPFDDTIINEALPNRDFGEAYLVPEWDTFYVTSYSPSSATVFGGFFHKSPTTGMIERWPLCPRNALIQAEKQLAMTRSNSDVPGLLLKGAFEEEFYLIPQSLEVNKQLMVNPDPYTFTNVYSLNEYTPILDEILDHLERHGVPVEQVMAESGPAQFEITWDYCNIKQACDRHIIVRQTVHAIAQKHGLYASFLPKPYLHKVGTGCHAHLSLWTLDGATNIVPDASEPTGVSPLGQRAIAGVLSMAKELTSLFNACPLSYRRLQPNCWSGCNIIWGLDNKEAMVRIASSPFMSKTGNSNFEIKTIDHTANPYLAMAGAIYAVIHGLDNSNIVIPPPTSANPAVMSFEEVSKMALEKLPTNLEKALDLLNNNQYLQSSLGTQLVNAFIQVKRAEVAFMKDKDINAAVMIYYKLF